MDEFIELFIRQPVLVTGQEIFLDPSQPHADFMLSGLGLKSSFGLKLCVGFLNLVAELFEMHDRLIVQIEFNHIMRVCALCAFDSSEAAMPFNLPV